MKNTILDLNSILIITNDALLKSNKVAIKLNNSDELIFVNLSSSRLKLFLKHYKTSLYNNDINLSDKDDLIEIPHRSIVLDDLKNFRKYFNNYSFSMDLDKIKNIFINNNISLEILNKFIVSSDYLWLKDLDENVLQNGIFTKRNKYHNILIDLKWECIPKELIYNYLISLLFKFKINKKGYIQDLSEKNSLEMEYSSVIKELVDKDFISLYYEIYEDDTLLNNYFNYYSNYCVYNGYSGNYETYFTFKELLKIYLEGINIYKYKDNYYTFKSFKNIYDIKSLEHSRFINDNMLEYHSNVNKAYEDLFKYNQEITILTCRCVNIYQEIDNNNFISNPLAKLELTFKPINKEIKVNKKIKLYLSDFL